MEQTEQFFLCECKSDGMLVSEWKDDDSQAFCFALFTRGQYIKAPNLWQRIKFALKHLWTGKYFDDEIVLDAITTDYLIEFLAKKRGKYTNTKGRTARGN